MQNPFAREELLIGSENVEKLKKASVAVFGIGGVGGYVAEALARSGVGTLSLIDNDKVSLTNINRQLYALSSTLGRYKVDVAKERILDINPEAVVYAYRTFYLPETAREFDFTAYDYVVDAIDTVTGKLQLAQEAHRCRTSFISAMGAGNKLDASAFQVADIYETKDCPLARVMRRELKKRGIPGFKVVYSREKPRKPLVKEEWGQAMEEEAGGEQAAGENPGCRRQIPGSISFVPPVAGFLIAGEVIKDLIGENETVYTGTPGGGI